MRSLFLALTLLAAPAHAACQPDGEIFSCQIGKKTLEVCHEGGALVYRFGPKGKAELTLSEPLETVTFNPWPGIGRYIWESIDFKNGDFIYRVYTSVERGPDATTGLIGSVTVYEGETELAYLACDDGTPTNSLDRVYDLKQSVGQCWDYASETWISTCD
jgi:hypothetical protein